MGRDKKLKKRIALESAPTDEAPISADIVEPASPQEEGLDRGEGYPSRLKEIRRQPGRSRSRHHKRK